MNPSDVAEEPQFIHHALPWENIKGLGHICLGSNRDQNTETYIKIQIYISDFKSFVVLEIYNWKEMREKSLKMVCSKNVVFMSWNLLEDL